jgi:GTPase
LKLQKDRLKRAAGRPPLLLSAVSGEGMRDALRQLLAVIDESKKADGPQKEVEPWTP